MRPWRSYTAAYLEVKEKVNQKAWDNRSTSIDKTASAPASLTYVCVENYPKIFCSNGVRKLLHFCTNINKFGRLRKNVICLATLLLVYQNFTCLYKVKYSVF
jgi:hypothetical protein